MKVAVPNLEDKLLETKDEIFTWYINSANKCLNTKIGDYQAKQPQCMKDKWNEIYESHQIDELKLFNEFLEANAKNTENNDERIKDVVIMANAYLQTHVNKKVNITQEKIKEWCRDKKIVADIPPECKNIYKNDTTQDRHWIIRNIELKRNGNNELQ